MAANARVLRNQLDIGNLFDEGPLAVFEFLSTEGLICETLICDKCTPIEALAREAPDGEGVLHEMKLVFRDGELRWRCSAHHERTIRHHSEFFSWEHETTVNGRNNSNR